MVEIKPGPELDRAVLEACGWRYRTADGIEGDVLGLRCWHDENDNQVHGTKVPSPSTDLNAAFEAEEEVFGCGFSLHTAGKPIGGWTWFRCIVGIGWCDNRCAKQFEVQATSPALAICAAILKLKETL